MSLLIYGATLLTPEAQIEDAAVVIEGDRIVQVGRRDQVVTPPDAEALNAHGLILAPGFIDLQLNGAFGDDFTTTPPAIWRVAARIPRTGVTSFLPTIITSPLEKIAQAQDTLALGRPAGFKGATPLGLHLEGPFLNPRKKGAHNPEYLRAPDLSLVANWSPETCVRLVTLAPELPGALDVIRCLTGRGVVVSAGHSMATYAQAEAGFAAGTRYGTHLFNAMSPLAHREPGTARRAARHTRPGRGPDPRRHARASRSDPGDLGRERAARNQRRYRMRWPRWGWRRDRTS